MCDRAPDLRTAVRTSLLQAFPGLHCFVRIAPAGSRWLLISDAPRHLGESSLRQAVESWGLPHVIESGLLCLDAPESAYQEALEAKCAFPTGSYREDYASLQATTVLLLRHPAPHPNPALATPLLREGWRAMALGEAQTRQWADDMRGVLASRLRQRETSGLSACGVLLASWLAKKDVTLPANTTLAVNLEE